MSVTKTKKIMLQIDRLERKAEEQMKIDYPIGRQVSWSHGSHDRMGEIVRHGHCLRVQICSLGKRLHWIYISRLHQ